ncbi:MAG: hypothetical protein GY775_12725 [Candidatus Scalindua sp.]|nr:hypothetical protein [Candidatus Scalindua sp.]
MMKVPTILLSVFAGILISLVSLIVAVLFLLGGPDARQTEFSTSVGTWVIAYYFIVLTLLVNSKKHKYIGIALILLLIAPLFWFAQLIGHVGMAIWLTAICCVFVVTKRTANKQIMGNNIAPNK